MSAGEPVAPPKSLPRKLAEVMKAVERIPKNGRNEYHQYDYATEADIVTAIRGLLADRDVILIPAITGRTREPVGDKGMVLTHLDMEFTFMDGETGQEITRPWLGAGTDKEDKGAYKAMTGGEKFFLLKTFLIPTGDDPEDEATPTDGEIRERLNQSKISQHKAQPQQASPRPHPDTRDVPRETPPERRAVASGHGDMLLISEAQGKRYYALAKRAGWEDDELHAWLLEVWGYKSSREIPRAKYDAVVKEVERGPEAAKR